MASMKRVCPGFEAVATCLTNKLGPKLCIENLAWGWTSRPDLFEKLLRLSGVWATLNVGHARGSPRSPAASSGCGILWPPTRSGFSTPTSITKRPKPGICPPQSLADLQDHLNLTMGTCGRNRAKKQLVTHQVTLINGKLMWHSP